MKKIMNDPSQIVDEMLDGLAYAHNDIVERLSGFDVITRTSEKRIEWRLYQVVAQVMSHRMQVLLVKVCYQQQ